MARRVLVDGRVQGVGFRQACAAEAGRHGVSGWVRNLGDGRVEAVFQGPAALVDAMVAWCRRGPSMASVTALEVSDEPPGEHRGFRVAPGDP